MSDRRRLVLSDERVYEAVLTAIERGDTDLLGGGVHARTLTGVEYFDGHEPALRKRLEGLEREGQLIAVQGIGPESGHARTSYLPTDDGNGAVGFEPVPRVERTPQEGTQ